MVFVYNERLLVFCSRGSRRQICAVSSPLSGCWLFSPVSSSPGVRPHSTSEILTLWQWVIGERQGAHPVTSFFSLLAALTGWGGWKCTRNHVTVCRVPRSPTQVLKVCHQPNQDCRVSLSSQPSQLRSHRYSANVRGFAWASTNVFCNLESVL